VWNGGVKARRCSKAETGEKRKGSDGSPRPEPFSLESLNCDRGGEKKRGGFVFWWGCGFVLWGCGCVGVWWWGRK